MNGTQNKNNKGRTMKLNYKEERKNWRKLIRKYLVRYGKT